MSGKANIRNIIYLGALLHDIGKFWQRAKEEVRYEKHQILTGGFVKQILQDEDIGFIALKHHREDLDTSIETGRRRILAEIVCEADNLASGEREKRTGEQLSALQSIFSRIVLNGRGAESRFYQPIGSQTSKDFRFPQTAVSSDVQLRKDNERQWDAMFDDLGILKPETILAHPDVLLPILRKHLWCIPSAYYRYEPDIPLYDHLKVTAAIAISLYDFLQKHYDILSQNEIKQIQKIIENRQEPRYILLCGDIAGIQKFIYRLSAKGAAKSLKGRSFFLQLLCDTIARWIIENDRINLPLANLLYSGGGKFYILAPSIIENKIHELSNEINRRLLKSYQGELYLALGWVKLTGEDFLHSEQVEGKTTYAISKKWMEAHFQMAKAKQRKFEQPIMEGGFFQPFGQVGKLITCVATQKEICLESELPEAKANGEAVPIPDTPNKYFCKEHKELENLGASLVDAEVMVLVKNSLLKGTKGQDWFEPLDLGYRYYFTKTRSQEIESRVQLTNDSQITLYHLSSLDFLKCQIQHPHTIYDFRFYGGSWMPKNEKGEIADFDWLAGVRGEIAKGRGFHRLGILRMDVDNLGRIFAEGLQGRNTISRLAHLSSMLDFFFNGYLTYLHNDPRFKNDLYITYSGGDDLFIVGNWRVIPETARDIYQKFREFTCYNPCLTLSGGIAVLPYKFPIYKGAEIAGRYEEKAKSLTRTQNGEKVNKDALTFLEKPLSWNDFEVAWEIKELLVRCLTEGQKGEKLKKGILDRFRQIYVTYEAGSQRYWSKWLWQATYSLHRYAKQNEAFKDDVNKICAALITNLWNGKQLERKLIEFLDVPTRWAELLTREEE